MKVRLTILIALAAISIGFSSCEKRYACDCTNYAGYKTTSEVLAKTPIEASKNCEKLGSNGTMNCKLQ
ncbi:MAG: hypothetical protein JST82_04355 [Bacteroidetes bacterium]|nr:hypothetical protein [Bacteroidota bacterium]